jgi:hypothetical protein
MADRNTARIFQLPAERIRDPVSEPARTNSSPTAADAIENEVQEALAICGGDAIAALRITLIANAFLEAEIDRLSAVVSSGFARGKLRQPQYLQPALARPRSCEPKRLEGERAFDNGCRPQRCSVHYVSPFLDRSYESSRPPTSQQRHRSTGDAIFQGFTSIFAL